MATNAEILKRAAQEDPQQLFAVIAANLNAQQVTALANQYKAAALLNVKREARRIAFQLQDLLDRADQSDPVVATWKAFIDANIGNLPTQGAP